MLAVAVLVLAAVPIGALGLLSGAPDASPTPSPPPAAVGPTSPPGSPTAQPVGSPTASPASSPVPTPAIVRTALVPVTHFRTTGATTGRDEVSDVLAGTSERYDALELVEADADAILAALDLQAPNGEEHLILAPDAATLAADLAENRSRLAILRADDVGPSVRALGWDGHALFGVDRAPSLDAWPLHADLLAFDRPTVPAAAPYDPAAAWTLFAAGDILLDRGVYQTLRINGKGADFPFDGGAAEITSRYCCSSFGWELPRTRRTGNAGAVRSLIQGADLAIANFENPAPNRFRFHTSGTVFTADPSLIDGLVNGGLDWVSLANNHIGDAGRQGILETMANLDERGLAHGGAGENLAAAREPSILDAGGVKVGILAYDHVARVYFAEDDRIGSAPMSGRNCLADVATARAAGAEVVVVFPHWGVEYRATPSPRQRELAHACLDAGADMVIGNHAHWAAAIEVYDGKPIWYALGNFIFDQTWSEPTMEGVMLELTFQGPDLRQIRMRPHIILDKAQPNFLDPAGDGRVVINQMYEGSRGLLDW